MDVEEANKLINKSIQIKKLKGTCIIEWKI